MILIAQIETSIDCSASHAFSVVSNMERFGEWFPAVMSIKSNNELPHASVGKNYLETVSVPMRGERKIELTVKEVVENARFVTEGDFPPLLPRMEIQIKEIGENLINLKWSMFSRNHSGIARVLLFPLIKRIMQKRANIGLFKLKTMLEASNT